MKRLSVILLLTVFFSCSDKRSESDETTNEDTPATKESIRGIWTDGDGPNPTMRIDVDSIYDLDLSEAMRYEFKDDTIFIFDEDEVFKAKVTMINQDTLIYQNSVGRTYYWRPTAADSLKMEDLN
jgi:hypothetical protein